MGRSRRLHFQTGSYVSLTTCRQVYQIFTRASQLSLQVSDEISPSTATNTNDDVVDAILETTLQGVEIINPERAIELRRENEEDVPAQPAAGPSAPTNLGMSTIHQQMINHQGNIVVVSDSVFCGGPAG